MNLVQVFNLSGVYTLSLQNRYCIDVHKYAPHSLPYPSQNKTKTKSKRRKTKEQKQEEEEDEVKREREEECNVTTFKTYHSCTEILLESVHASSSRMVPRGGPWWMPSHRRSTYVSRTLHKSTKLRSILISIYFLIRYNILSYIHFLSRFFIFFFDCSKLY